MPGAESTPEHPPSGLVSIDVWPSAQALGVRLAGQGVHATHPRIGPLRRFWVRSEERIILATALIAHLRKRTNARRLRLSTCKAGALPAELRPRALMSIVVPH